MCNPAVSGMPLKWCKRNFYNTCGLSDKLIRFSVCVSFLCRVDIGDFHKKSILTNSADRIFCTKGFIVWLRNKRRFYRKLKTPFRKLISQFISTYQNKWQMCSCHLCQTRVHIVYWTAGRFVSTDRSRTVVLMLFVFCMVLWWQAAEPCLVM